MRSTTYWMDTIHRLTAAVDLPSRCAIALAGLAAGSCAIEGSEACGAHQVYEKGNSVIDYAVCVCDEADGYVFDMQRGHGCRRCPEGQMALGGKCVADTSDAGAQEGDAASTSEPTGVGEPCGSNEDCAGYDATYCAQGSCLVEKCATGENTCGSSAVCCDYSALLAGFSLCLPPEQLNEGNCPMGGMKVEP